MNRRRFLAQTFTATGALSIAPTLVSAQTAAETADRIWIEPPRPTSGQSDWYPRVIASRQGRVLGLDAKQLRWIGEGDESETIIAAKRVLWIEPGGQSEAQRNALSLFRAGEFAASVRPLLDLLAEKPPVWRQQWLSMLAAYAAWRGSMQAIALELVAQLDRRQLPPVAVAMLPVAWSGATVPAKIVDDAPARLADPSPAVRLVAASWLLGTSQRSAATAALEQLATSPTRPLIARMAEAVRWRVATPPQVVDSIDLWQRKLDALPMVLQVGPTVTLIEKLRSSGQPERARRLRWSLQLTPPYPHPEIGTLDSDSPSE